MDHVMLVGGWYIEDGEYQVSARRVMKIIESASDPRSEYFQVMRRENIPADELMGRRMEIGVIAVLAQLGAERNWHRIMREWVYADEPETELGAQEWEYFETRGVRRVPGIAAALIRHAAGSGACGRRARACGLRRRCLGLHAADRDDQPDQGDRRDDPQAELDPGRRTSP